VQKAATDCGKKEPGIVKSNHKAWAYQLLNHLETGGGRELGRLFEKKQKFEISKWQVAVNVYVKSNVSAEEMSLLEIACLNLDPTAMNYLNYLGAKWTVGGISVVHRLFHPSNFPSRKQEISNILDLLCLHEIEYVIEPTKLSNVRGFNFIVLVWCLSFCVVVVGGGLLLLGVGFWSDCTWESEYFTN